MKKIMLYMTLFTIALSSISTFFRKCKFAIWKYFATYSTLSFLRSNEIFRPVVFQYMTGVCGNLKVTFSIVKLVSVFVVNMLCWFKWATKVLLHNISMFKIANIVYCNPFITVFVNAPNTRRINLLKVRVFVLFPPRVMLLAITPSVFRRITNKASVGIYFREAMNRIGVTMSFYSRVMHGAITLLIEFLFTSFNRAFFYHNFIIADSGITGNGYVTPPIALPLSAGTVAQQVALNVPGQIKYIDGGEIPLY